MISFLLFLQVATADPQFSRDSVNKALLPIRREVEALKLEVRRGQGVAAEQSRITADIRGLLEANEQEDLRRRLNDSALVNARLSSVNAALAAQKAQSEKLRTIVVGAILLLAMGAGLVFWILSRRVAGSEQAIEAVAPLRATVETTDLELRVIRAELTRLGSLTQRGTEASPDDHSFALAVAGELHRMQTRLRSMPPETVGLSALQRSLERLTEALGALGYSIPELVGKPYVQGMVVEARFVASDSLGPGESLITKVVRPQVNYRETLIQAADVEVSTG